jgi:hypothetical protein
LTNLFYNASSRRTHINWSGINSVALQSLPDLVGRWCPDAKLEGHEYVMRNPRRADGNAGSFKINARTGRWADFAVSGAKGGDVISFAAYLHGLSNCEAACRLAGMLGLEARR